MSRPIAPTPRTYRILMYATYFWPEYSGAALQALALARELRQRGHHVEFVTVRWPGLARDDSVDGFTVHRLGYGGANKHREFNLWFGLARFLWRRRGDFDLLHSHGAYYTNSIVGLFGKLMGIKSLVKASLANDDLKDLEIPLIGSIHKQLLSFVDRYVAISGDLLDEFRCGGFAASRLRHIPNGVDTATFKPVDPATRSDIRAALGLPEERSVFLYVGVFDERKNIRWLAEQWVGMERLYRQGLLLAVGPQSRDDRSGLLIEQLRALAGQHPDRFALRDFTSRVTELYQAADALVLPSQREGLPNVVLEALATGLPCIAARVSGSRELIVDGHNGYTYAPDDANDLARVLELTRANAARLRHNAREHALATYSIQAVAERYVELYDELCSAAPNVPPCG